MATSNRDFPRGFWPAYTKHGGPPAMNRYYTSGTAAIYIGDVLKFNAAAGNHGVTPCDGSTDDDSVIGIAATHTTSLPGGSTASDAVEIFVYDDLINTVFIAQTDTSVTTEMNSSTCVPAHYALNVGSASSALPTSNHEINSGSTGAGSGYPIYVIDKVDRPDNAWGGSVDCYCQIVAKHHSFVGSTGIVATATT